MFRRSFDEFLEKAQKDWPQGPNVVEPDLSCWAEEYGEALLAFARAMSREDIQKCIDDRMVYEALAEEGILSRFVYTRPITGRCNVCKGRGTLRWAAPPGKDYPTEKEPTCPYCNGTGEKPLGVQYG